MSTPESEDYASPHGKLTDRLKHQTVASWEKKHAHRCFNSSFRNGAGAARVVCFGDVVRACGNTTLWSAFCVFLWQPGAGNTFDFWDEWIQMECVLFEGGPIFLFCSMTSFYILRSTWVLHQVVFVYCSVCMKEGRYLESEWLTKTVAFFEIESVSFQ